MKLKQFLSTALALVMVFSLSIPVLAADYSTAVSYDGTGTERYELTVPSQLKPGTSGNVTLSGTWASNRHIAVTADKTVAMTGSLGGSETLDITFAGIDLAGDNEAAVSETKPVSVASLDALFGTWTGVFYYNVGAADVGCTTVNPGGSSTGTGSEGDSSSSDPLEGVDVSQAVEFTITKSNRAAVGYTGEENENLVIPAYFVGDGKNGTTKGQVYKVTGFANATTYHDGAFAGCGNLISVTIPNSVTSIEKYAFYGCRGLTSVTITEGVTAIGQSAFYYCSNLTSVTIPEGVTSIKDSAFEKCSKLSSVTISNSVTSISYSAFSYCSSLTSINVDTNNNNYSSDNGVLFNKDKTTLIECPEGKSGAYTIPNFVTSIQSGAFSCCSNLTSITIPDSVTIIESNAFGRCSSLTSITIPESVTSIPLQAFYKCTGLTSITIPNSVTNIQEQAFINCSGLASITIPESVTKIGNKAFYGCSSLTSVNIPKDVTSIGCCAFHNCTSLTSISVDPNNSTYSSDECALFNKNKSSLIQYYAWMSETYTVPSFVKRIEYAAFDYCDNLTNVTISEGVTSIGKDAFFGCYNLTSVTIPESITSIGNRAFIYCRSLTNITFNGTQEQWKAITKMNSWNDSTGSYTIYCTDGNISK